MLESTLIRSGFGLTEQYTPRPQAAAPAPSFAGHHSWYPLAQPVAVGATQTLPKTSRPVVEHSAAVAVNRSENRAIRASGVPRRIQVERNIENQPLVETALAENSKRHVRERGERPNRPTVCESFLNLDRGADVTGKVSTRVNGDIKVMEGRRPVDAGMPGHGFEIANSE